MSDAINTVGCTGADTLGGASIVDTPADRVRHSEFVITWALSDEDAQSAWTTNEIQSMRKSDVVLRYRVRNW